MHLVISGEGKSDIGIGSYEDGTFLPAPMYYIADKIIEKKLSYSIYTETPTEITFIPKAKLIAVCKSLKSFTGKKRGQETGYFYKNALGLAKVAKEKGDDSIAILFRDSDGTGSSPSYMYEKKVESIENAFMREKVNGVAMIPNPKSEAWLICALKKIAYHNCNSLEQRSGNDDSPNSLKKELIQILENIRIEYNDINEMIKNNTINIDQIKMNSFQSFKIKLEDALKR